MSNPSVPTKSTGDTLSATEVNAIVNAFPTKVDVTFLGLFGQGISQLASGQVIVNAALASIDAIGFILTYSTLEPENILGILCVLDTDIVEGVSFIIKSLNNDGTLNTNDNSFVRWGIIGAI